MRPSPFSLAFAAALVSASTARATDWVVDDGGGAGVDFTTIQAAVDAAQSGDHVIVRAGTYAGFTIDGKGIVVAVSPGHVATITGPVRVLQTPAGAGVQLIALTLDRSNATGQLPLEIASCVGPVTVASCTLRGFDGHPATDAARVGACTRVFFHECELEGGDAPLVNGQSQGGHGLRVVGSTVEVHRSTLRGGRGGSTWDGTDQDDLFDGQPGGPGLSLENASALVERSTATGGHGGDGSSGVFDTRCPGDGGDGVHVFSGALAHHLSTFTGAPAGFDVGFGSCLGVHGIAVDPPAAATPADRFPICPALYTRCPCGNEGSGANGCANSITSAGARLDVAGAASLAGDTLTLSITGIGATAPALFFQGTAAAGNGFGSAFGDGIRCAGGVVTRLESRNASGGAASLGFAAGDAPISTTGQVPGPGAARLYQVWYRNSATFCTASTFNLTNGYEVLWGG